MLYTNLPLAISHLVVYICQWHFPIKGSDVFIYLSDICKSLLEKCLLRYFVYFLIGLFYWLIDLPIAVELYEFYFLIGLFYWLIDLPIAVELYEFFIYFEC